jgi:YVTN family beta-propeller protein
MEASRATLQGRVNPEGTEAAAWFEWGPTSDYGNVTPSQSLGNGTNELPITEAVIDLIPSTAYHYRVVAENSAGRTVGSDIIFATSGIVAPVVTTGSASVITKTGATLQGTIIPNGFIANGWFEWGITTSYGNSSLRQSLGNGSDPVAVSQAISGLTTGTLYHYRAVGENGGGGTFGPDQTFTTLAATLNTPDVVSTAASNITHTTAALNGTINPNGLSSVAWFEWGTSDAYGTATPAQSVGAGSMATPINQTISGLLVGVIYHYRIVGQNSDGTAAGDDQSFTPIPYQAQAYLPNSGGTVSVVDLSTNNITKTITVGDNPVAAVATPDGGKVYVLNSSSATVSVIETVGNTVIATIPIVVDPSFGLPLQSIGVTPDGTEVYVGGNRDLSVIDTATDTLKTTITLSVGGVYKFLFTSTGTRLYAAGTDMFIIDPHSNQLIDGILGTSADWALSPDESRLYRITYGKNAGLNAYSTATNGLIGSVPGLAGLRVLVSSDGSKIYVSQIVFDLTTSTYSQNIAVVNAVTFTSINTLTGVSGWGSLLSSGGTVYAGSMTGGQILGSNNTITVIDTSTDTVKKTLTPPGSSGKSLPYGNLIYFIQANGNQVGIIDTSTDTLMPAILAPADDIAISAR